MESCSIGIAGHKKVRRRDLHARIEVWREGIKRPIDSASSLLPFLV